MDFIKRPEDRKQTISLWDHPLNIFTQHHHLLQPALAVRCLTQHKGQPTWT